MAFAKTQTEEALNRQWWLVRDAVGGQAPGEVGFGTQHKTRERAEAQAREYADRHRRPFYVLAAVKSFSPKMEVIEAELEAPVEISFG